MQSYSGTLASNGGTSVNVATNAGLVEGGQTVEIGARMLMTPKELINELLRLTYNATAKICDDDTKNYFMQQFYSLKEQADMMTYQ